MLRFEWSEFGEDVIHSTPDTKVGGVSSQGHGVSRGTGTQAQVRSASKPKLSITTLYCLSVVSICGIESEFYYLHIVGYKHPNSISGTRAPEISFLLVWALQGALFFHTLQILGNVLPEVTHWLAGLSRSYPQSLSLIKLPEPGVYLKPPNMNSCLSLVSNREVGNRVPRLNYKIRKTNTQKNPTKCPTNHIPLLLSGQFIIPSHLLKNPPRFIFWIVVVSSAYHRVCISSFPENNPRQTNRTSLSSFG